MTYEFFNVNAFTNKIFKGNPACVVPLKNWLPDEILLKIAKENALPETAFFIKNDDIFHLRWFTPDIEMDLCGHATLAASHVIKTELNYQFEKINFQTISGDLQVTFSDDFYYMNFPSRKAKKTTLPINITLALNIKPKEIYKARDYMLIYENEKEISSIKIDRTIFNKINLGTGGVIVTAKGQNADFVSRFFTPQATILEDPVTGSSHCTLIPYWSDFLSKKQLSAVQISERGGSLSCVNKGHRVLIGGQAKLFSKGTFYI